MTTRYLILRANMSADRSFAFFNATAWQPSTPGPSDLEVKILDAHERDAVTLRADPRNVAVTDAAAVLSLIRPTSQASADATTLATLKTVGAAKLPDGLVAVGAHASPFSGQGVTVAVLDTGIDDGHPVFQGKNIVKQDFVGEGTSDRDVTDSVGHGTHCAATICAAPVGDIRVGVAPGIAKLCVGKVVGRNGGTIEMLTDALLWAVRKQRADVVSMSLGYDLAGNTKRLIENGVDPARAADAILQEQADIVKVITTLRAFLESQVLSVMFVAAAGNESDRSKDDVRRTSLPASEFLSVGAVGPVGDKWNIAPFSNGQAKVVGPGVDVVSASPGGGWAIMTGTSMAAPHVAGVAALWIEKLRNESRLSAEAVQSAIIAHAVTQPLLTTDLGAVGAGLVQAPQN